MLAHSYKHYDHFHTTFMIRKNKIVAMGINNPHKTHPYNLKYPYSSEFKGIHSELAAIIHYGSEVCEDIIFLNLKIGKTGKLFLSKPCLGCQSLLKQVGFKKMFYSDTGEKIVQWNI